MTGSDTALPVVPSLDPVQADLLDWVEAGRVEAETADADGSRRYTALVPAERGAVRLEFDGLAGLCTLTCDGLPVAASSSAFSRLVLDLPDTGADRRLELLACPLDAELTRRRPRGRWRSTLVAEQALRWWRTPMLGRAPFLGPVHPVLGPYRPCRIVDAARPRWVELAIDTGFSAVRAAQPACHHPDRAAAPGTGRLVLRGLLDRVPVSPIRVSCAGRELAVTVVEGPDGCHLSVHAEVDEIQPWWPHTHGSQTLYPLLIHAGEDQLLDTRVGFRELAVDLAAGADGAGVRFAVNGCEVHARGAVWTPLHPEALRSTPRELREAVCRAAQGGANLLRIVGTTVYEQPEFWQACAEAGVLVWQDLMIANIDPPEDEDFEELVLDEVRRLLLDASGSPALAVLSGGREVRQQAELSGVALGNAAIPLLDAEVPELLETLRPGTPYVPSTPWTPPGQGPAVRVGVGVAHYFGVGGYRRPLADVRTADVRFAAECLAFSVPPMPWRVEADFGGPARAGHAPEWKAGVPRDRLASWDFEDVREHYVAERHGVDVRSLRAIDPERYLALGAETIAALAEEVLGWWRSSRSSSAGCLVLTARDLVPGAGWGMLDHLGVPKSLWYAARRRWAPRALWVDDRGLDGLWVELHADCPEALGPGELTLRCCGAGGEVLFEGHRAVAGTGPWSVDEIVGAVADIGYAYRFGPPAVACIDLEWSPEDGGQEPLHLVWVPAPSAAPEPRPAEVEVTQVALGGGRWGLALAASAPVRHVLVDVPGFIPSDSYFAMAPGRPVSVELEPVDPVTPESLASARAPRPRIGALQPVTVRLMG